MELAIKLTSMGGSVSQPNPWGAKVTMMRWPLTSLAKVAQLNNTWQHQTPTYPTTQQPRPKITTLLQWPHSHDHETLPHARHVYTVGIGQRSIHTYVHVCTCMKTHWDACPLQQLHTHAHIRHTCIFVCMFILEERVYTSVDPLY